MIGRNSVSGVRWRALAVAMVTLTAVAACAAPGPTPSDVAPSAAAPSAAATTAPSEGAASATPGGLTTDPVTLVVQDVSGVESRGAALEQLNKEFMELHPNVTIERVLSSFTDLQPKQAIQMSGPNPPDVIEIVVPNDTFAKMGNENLIANLDPYVEQYGWADRFPASLLDQGRFDSSGQILSGPHYGIYMVEDVVGVYYNKAKLEALGLQVPTTWEDFEASLAAAKQAGEIPMMLGNIEKWPVGHIYGMLYNRYATTEDINGWTFNTKPDVTWEAAQFLKATEGLQSWGQNDYFTPDFNAVDYNDAGARFIAGEGLYYPAGTWVTAPFVEAPDSNFGFFLPPPLKDDPDLRIEGGQGQFWAISGKSKNPDVAAAYLDWITSQRAGELLIEAGAIPGFRMETIPALEPGVFKEVFEAVQDVNANYTISTYVDASTSTMLVTMGEGQQKLLAGQMTPAEFTVSVQQDHDAAYKP